MFGDGIVKKGNTELKYEAFRNTESRTVQPSSHKHSKRVLQSTTKKAQKPGKKVSLYNPCYCVLLVCVGLSDCIVFTTAYLFVYDLSMRNVTSGCVCEFYWQQYINCIGAHTQNGKKRLPTKKK